MWSVKLYKGPLPLIRRACAALDITQIWSRVEQIYVFWHVGPYLIQHVAILCATKQDAVPAA